MQSTRRNTVFFLFLALAMLSASAGFGGESGGLAAKEKTGDRRIVVGHIIPSTQDSWWLRQWQGATAVAKERGFALMRSENHDADKIVAFIRNLRKQGAEGVIIGMEDVRESNRVVNACRELGLKLYSVGHRLLGDDGLPVMEIPHTELSRLAVGEDMGALMHEEAVRRGWKWDGTAAVLLGMEESLSSRERVSGTRAKLLEYGFPAERVFDAIVSSREYLGSQDASDTSAAIDDIMSDCPGITHWLVGGGNDSVTLGAVRVLEERGFDHDSIIAIGINMSEEARREFEKPKPTGFFATIKLSGVEHGRLMAERMYRWVRDGVEPPLNDPITDVAVTRESYHAEEGLQAGLRKD